MAGDVQWEVFPHQGHAEKQNGLEKPSVVDTLQLRGVALERFVGKCGRLSADEMAEIAAAIAAVV